MTEGGPVREAKRYVVPGAASALRAGGGIGACAGHADGQVHV